MRSHEKPGSDLPSGRCTVCESIPRTLRDPQFSYAVHFCPDCGYIAKSPSVRLAAEQERAQYALHENTLENTGYVHMLTRFLDRIPDIGSVKRALDFGSGPGPVLAHLMRERGIDAAVYDPFFAPDKRALERSYALVTCTEVLEHLWDPLKAFRDLTSCLDPGGRLAVTTLFHGENDEMFFQWWYRRDPTHVGFFSPKTLRRLAAYCGLEVECMDSRNFCVFRKPDNLEGF